MIYPATVKNRRVNAIVDKRKRNHYSVFAAAFLAALSAFAIFSATTARTAFAEGEFSPDADFTNNAEKESEYIGVTFVVKTVRQTVISITFSGPFDTDFSFITQNYAYRAV